MKPNGWRGLWSQLRRREDGGVAVEFAIISMVLILGCLGVVEFGRVNQLRNELSSIADRGARQILTNSDVSDATVEASLRQVFDGPQPSQLQVTLGTETVDGTQFRTLALSYPVTLLIPGLSAPGITLHVERRTPVT